MAMDNEALKSENTHKYAAIASQSSDKQFSAMIAVYQRWCDTEDSDKFMRLKESGICYNDLSNKTKNYLAPKSTVERQIMRNTKKWRSSSANNDDKGRRRTFLQVQKIINLLPDRWLQSNVDENLAPVCLLYISVYSVAVNRLEFTENKV